MRSLGKRANLSPAALRSNLTLAMRLVNQLNSLKTAIEFATSQGWGRIGLAALPASVIEVFVRFPLRLKYSKSLSL